MAGLQLTSAEQRVVDQVRAGTLTTEAEVREALDGRDPRSVDAVLARCEGHLPGPDAVRTAGRNPPCAEARLTTTESVGPAAFRLAVQARGLAQPAIDPNATLSPEQAQLLADRLCHFTLPQLKRLLAGLKAPNGASVSPFGAVGAVEVVPANGASPDLITERLREDILQTVRDHPERRGQLTRALDAVQQEELQGRERPEFAGVSDALWSDVRDPGTTEGRVARSGLRLGLSTDEAASAAVASSIINRNPAPNASVSASEAARMLSGYGRTLGLEVAVEADGLKVVRGGEEHALTLDRPLDDLSAVQAAGRQINQLQFRTERVIPPGGLGVEFDAKHTDADRDAFCAQASRMAYFESDVVKAWSEAAGMDACHYFHDPKTDGHAYVFVKDGQRLVAPRGSANLTNWKNNARFRMNDRGEHTGFAHTADGLLCARDEHGNTLMDVVGDEGVSFTGHSLGGAISAIVVKRMVEEGKADQIGTVHTYGAPRAMSTLAADELERSGVGDRWLRRRNGRDLVTQVPPGKGYAHVGQSASSEDYPPVTPPADAHREKVEQTMALLTELAQREELEPQHREKIKRIVEELRAEIEVGSSDGQEGENSIRTVWGYLLGGTPVLVGANAMQGLVHATTEAVTDHNLDHYQSAPNAQILGP